MKKQFISILTAAVLMLSMLACAAVAENGISLTNTTLHVGNKAYTLPASVTELTEQGVNFPEMTGLDAEHYAPMMKVDNGRNGFTLCVRYLTTTEDPYWVTGVNWDSGEYAGMAVGGMVLGETTREEIIRALGPDHYGKTYEGTSLTYYAWEMNYSWALTFDGETPEAKLTRVIVGNSLVTQYGVVDASKAGVADADLPDPATMSFAEFILDGKHYVQGVTLQELLDDGWVMPANMNEKTVEARRGSRVNGAHVELYNGASMVKVSAYNVTDAECSFAACTVGTVTADTACNASIVCADGLANGVSTYDEAVSILGEPAKTVDGENGAKEVLFNVLNSMKYTLLVNADGVVTGITIDGLL